MVFLGLFLGLWIGSLRDNVGDRVVQGFYRFPCFMAGKGMRNHPPEQPDPADIFRASSGEQAGPRGLERRWFLSHLMALGCCGVSGQGAVVLPDIHATIHRARQAWLGGDRQGFAQLFTPSGELVVPGQRWQGPQAISEAFQAFTQGHEVLAIEISNLVVQGDRAILEWYWEDRDLHTGQTSKAEDAIAIDFQGDRIQRWREYIDTKSLADA
jgi:uncharacterized protein (TIGR02246 family)